MVVLPTNQPESHIRIQMEFETCPVGVLRDSSFWTRGTFKDPKSLARELATTLKMIEKVPDIPMFRQNTAGFVHDLPNGTLSNVEGDSNYVRVQVLTNAGALDRDKQLAVVRQFTDLVAAAAGDASLADRTWVPLTEAVEGGWDSLVMPTPTRSS